jgi:hypothetical protein
MTEEDLMAICGILTIIGVFIGGIYIGLKL